MTLAPTTPPTRTQPRSQNQTKYCASPLNASSPETPTISMQNKEVVHSYYSLVKVIWDIDEDTAHIEIIDHAAIIQNPCHPDNILPRQVPGSRIPRQQTVAGENVAITSYFID
ncbi:hypothetical protein V5O48_018267 [Marasmius crinis-equi]|uniref:Uncharacterized protein n=1 Tax=Marasmius crinis-equi TaxID=585013 RepID=A0ABR3ELN8_9AGAR